MCHHTATLSRCTKNEGGAGDEGCLVVGTGIAVAGYKAQSKTRLV